MSAIDEDEELNAGGAAVIEEGIEGGAGGAAGVEDVVHEDDVFALDGEGDFGGVELGLGAYGREVVAIEVDVEDAYGDFPVFEGFDLGG
jgi:hypothetical protein